MERRKFLRAAPPVLFTAGLAGCSDSQNSQAGQDSSTQEEPDEGTDDNTADESNSEENYWPPPRNTIDNILPTAPGDSVDTLSRIWGSGIGRVTDVDLSYTNNAGAQGMLAYNDVSEAEANGGTMGTVVYNALIPSEMGRETARYTSSEFIHLKTLYQRIRGVQLNPRTTHVDSHFDTTWDEFVENAPYQLGASGVHHLMTHRFIEEFEPRLEEGDIESVNFNSGSEVRAAVRRDDIDGYTGGFASNLSPDRVDAYKMQFAVIDSRYPSTVDRVRQTTNPDTGETVGDNAVLLENTSYPEDGVQNVVDATIDAVAFVLPPETPDEVVTQLDEGFQTLYEEQEDRLMQEIDDAFGDTLTMYYEGSMEETQNFASDKIETLQEYDEIIGDIFAE